MQLNCQGCKCSAHAFSPECTCSYWGSLLNSAQHLELALLVSHTLRNAQDCHSQNLKSCHKYDNPQQQCCSFVEGGNCNRRPWTDKLERVLRTSICILLSIVRDIGRRCPVAHFIKSKMWPEGTHVGQTYSRSVGLRLRPNLCESLWNQVLVSRTIWRSGIKLI